MQSDPAITIPPATLSPTVGADAAAAALALLRPALKAVLPGAGGH